MSKSDKSADAVRFFYESVEAKAKGDNNQAYQLLLACVRNDPTLTGAWLNLGVILHESKYFPASAAAFSKCLNLAPDTARPMADFAWNLHLSGRTDEALPLLVRAISLETTPQALWHTNLSQILLTQGDYEGCLSEAQKAFDLNESEPMNRLALALACLRNGDYVNGFKHYEARIPKHLPDMMKYPYPLWRGEDISDKRLFLVAEQGLGDSIMFLHFVKMAIPKAQKVIVYVHDQAVTFFQMNLPRKVEVHPLPKELPPADVFCPFISLPVALQLTNEEMQKPITPYVVPSAPCPFPNNGRKRIGICWAGDPAHDNDKWRSATLAPFLRLAEIPNADIYSLQIGKRGDDLNAIGAHAVVTDLAPYIKTAADTAAIISQLNYVVTVDTSVVLIAGCVGTPTIDLLSHNKLDWRWGKGEDKTHWFPKMTLMRQAREGDWEEVMERAKHHIINNFNKGETR